MERFTQTVLMVFHTHWDREWYRGREDFRFRLGEAVRRIMQLVADGGIRHFHLDGQTIVLEDAAAIMSPDERGRLAGLIRRGIVDVGPWYVLPDEFLAGPEGLVRNLEIGLRLAREWGAEPSWAYLPDTFGHIAQMPQLIASFGLSGALVFRGVEPGTVECRWTGPDGTAVPAAVLSLRDGYYQTQLNADEGERGFDPGPAVRHLEALAADSRGAWVLFMPGADHTVPAADMGARVRTLRRALRRRWPEAGLADVSFAEACQRLRDDEPAGGRRDITGEQRDQTKAYVLPGTLSARSYLKRENQECSDLLAGIVEPLAALAPHAAHRPDYERLLWKLLIENHPHDSICGCSTDAVHREMMARFVSVRDGAAAYRQSLESALAAPRPAGFNDWLWVLCPTPQPGRRVVEAEIHVPAALDRGSLELERSERDGGGLVAATLLERRETDGFGAVLDRFPDWTPGFCYRVRFADDFPGLGLRSYRIRPAAPTRGWTGAPLGVPSGVLDNGRIRLEVADDGGLRLEDRQSGQRLDGLGLITSNLDAGDEYTWAPPERDRQSRAAVCSPPVRTLRPDGQELELSLILRTPAGLDAERRGPASAEVETPIRLRVELRDGESMVRIQAVFDNRARDQIVRAWFPLPGTVAETRGDTPFDFTRRPHDRSVTGLEPRFTAPAREAPGGLPVWSCASAGPLRVHVLGSCEYDCVPFDAQRDALRLTLVRSVGRLSGRTLSSRGGGAGPAVDTPEAQCLGEQRFAWGLSLAAEDEALAEARAFRLGCHTFQGSRPAAGTAALRLDDPVLVLSALRRLSDGRTLVRLFNPSAQARSIVLTGAEGLPYRLAPCGPDGAALPAGMAAGGLDQGRLRPGGVLSAIIEDWPTDPDSQETHHEAP